MGRRQVERERSNPNKKLIARLRALRLYFGYTRASLARRSGLASMQVSHLELGESKVKTARIRQALARAYSITPEILVSYLHEGLIPLDLAHHAELLDEIERGHWSRGTLAAVRDLLSTATWNQADTVNVDLIPMLEAEDWRTILNTVQATLQAVQQQLFTIDPEIMARLKKQVEFSRQMPSKGVITPEDLVKNFGIPIFQARMFLHEGVQRQFFQRVYRIKGRKQWIVQLASLQHVFEDEQGGYIDGTNPENISVGYRFMPPGKRGGRKRKYKMGVPKPSV